jgi:hypothetical protein
MWKNIVQSDRPQDDNIVPRMRIACGVPKATNTHPEHVKLTAFGGQKWLRRSAPIYFYLRTESGTVIEISRLLFCDFWNARRWESLQVE